MREETAMKVHPSFLRRAAAVASLYFLIFSLLAVSPGMPSVFAAPGSQPYATPTPVVQTFSDASTAEQDIKNYIQSRLDLMSGQITFTVTGTDACKLFLVTDGGGNIVLPLTNGSFTSYCLDIFSQQLDAMASSNYNAYTKFAMTGYQVGGSSSIMGNDTETLQLTFTYTITWRDETLYGISALNARNAVTAFVQTFLSSPGYPASGSSDQKLRAINEYICSTFQYDYRLFSTNAEEQNDVIYTAYGMITDTKGAGGYPRGVCQAYAMVGYLMLREAGFGAICISGRAAGGGHAWNMVRVGTRWYHMDFTWDDPVSSTSDPVYPLMQDGAGTVSFNYYMRTDEEMRVNHDWDPVTDTGYVYPVANTTWSGNDPIEDITQPPPPPTSTPVPTPTIEILPTVTLAPSSAVRSSAENASSSEAEQSSEAGGSSAETSSAAASVIYSKAVTLSDGTGSSRADSDAVSGEACVTITGRLLGGSGEPLPGVRLLLFSTNRMATTNSRGEYRFDQVKVGNYKIFVLDDDGNEVAELPIVITFGDQTVQTQGTVQVRGGTLIMDLTYSGNALTIKSVSSPVFGITRDIVIYTAIGAVILGALLIFILMRRDRSGGHIPMD